jgi:3-oxoadipate enol-lactonase
MVENTENAGFAEVNGAKIYYEIQGSGPPVVLIHQRGLDRRAWDDQVPDLSGRYGVVRYDRRYWGRTEVEGEAALPSEFSDLDSVRQWLEEQPPSPAAYEDLYGLLDQLGIERAHLLGLQDGGEVALDFALEYPEKASALVLVNTFVFSLGDPQSQAKLVERGVQKAMGMQGAIERALREKDPRAIVDWALDDPSHDACGERTRQRLREIYTDNASSSLFPRDYNVRRLDPPAGERLNEIEAPTLLILSGERDPDIREFNEALAANIPASTKVALPGACQFVNMERPEEFNRTIMEFLEGL